jgi:hypothetical protein
MNEQENYTPTPADEALQATLLTGHVCLTIQQEYANGNIADLAAYNRLYEAARKADGQVRKLFDLLGTLEKLMILSSRRDIHKPFFQGRQSLEVGFHHFHGLFGQLHPCLIGSRHQCDHRLLSLPGHCAGKLDDGGHRIEQGPIPVLF